MVIDFNKINEVVTPNFKGGEGAARMRTQYDGMNKIMMGRLLPGCTIGYHIHDESSEIIYITSGTARCLYDGGEPEPNGANAIIEKHLVSNYVLKPFEGKKFQTPIGYDAYLHQLYGDYMEIPSEKQRKSTHVFQAWWKN